VYQQWNNFDDNAFAWFSAFQQSRPGDALFDKGMKRYRSLIAEFEKDLNADTLPAVSWIIAPSSRSEHATNHPSGAAYSLPSLPPSLHLMFDILQLAKSSHLAF
jgi:phospholipase C